MIYALVFMGRSGEPFPDGLEIYALPYAKNNTTPKTVEMRLTQILHSRVRGLSREEILKFDAFFTHNP